MRRNKWRNRVAGSLLAVAALNTTGCLSADDISSLLDISAETTGSVVAILVRSGLEKLFGPAAENDPALEGPISEQEH